MIIILIHIAPIILLYLYLCYGIDYAYGSAEYCRFNNVKPYHENPWDSIINESVELWYAIKQFSIKDIILEASDVLHALIKCIIVTYLPQSIYCSSIMWLCVFPLALPTTIKGAIRYQTWKCIRNHKNQNNCNHKCNYVKQN